MITPTARRPADSPKSVGHTTAVPPPATDPPATPVPAPAHGDPRPDQPAGQEVATQRPGQAGIAAGPTRRHLDQLLLDLVAEQLRHGRLMVGRLTLLDQPGHPKDQ